MAVKKRSTPKLVPPMKDKAESQHDRLEQLDLVNLRIKQMKALLALLVELCPEIGQGEDLRTVHGLMRELTDDLDEGINPLREASLLQWQADRNAAAGASHG